MGMRISVRTEDHVGWLTATRNPRVVLALRNDVILKKTIKDDVGVLTVECLLAHQSWQNLTAAATTTWYVRPWTWRRVGVRRVINLQDDLQQNA